MGRKKNLNIVVSYGSTGMVINDFGPDKSPRFELYDLINKISIKKSNNPYDFDKIICILTYRRMYVKKYFSAASRAECACRRPLLCGFCAVLKELFFILLLIFSLCHVIIKMLYNLTRRDKVTMA